MAAITRTNTESTLSISSNELVREFTNVGTLRIQDIHIDDSPNDKIILDVGGQIFPARKHTLTSRSGYFRGMFSGDFKSPEDSPIFIDRDPLHFRCILNYLRHGDLDINPKAIRRELMREAQFYSLTGLVDLLRHKNRLQLQLGNHVFSSDEPREIRDSFAMFDDFDLTIVGKNKLAQQACFGLKIRFVGLDSGCLMFLKELKIRSELQIGLLVCEDRQAGTPDQEWTISQSGERRGEDIDGDRKVFFAYGTDMDIHVKVDRVKRTTTIVEVATRKRYTLKGLPMKGSYRPYAYLNIQDFKLQEKDKISTKIIEIRAHFYHVATTRFGVDVVE